jgi:hypothetical protein
MKNFQFEVTRCIELEEEYDSIQNINITSEDIEDINDIYQEKLEQQYYKRELVDEYRILNDIMGLHNRHLDNKSSRRNF